MTLEAPMVDAGKKAINWFNWVNWLWLSVPASIVLLHNYWDIVDRHLLNYDWFASRRIISQKVDVTAKAPYVERKSLNSKLAPLISTASYQCYVIVGPRGSSNSTSVEQACQGIEGVARIRGGVDKNNVNVFELVADAFGVNSCYYSLNEQDDLVKLFRQVSAKMGGSWVPTIIAELIGELNPELLKMFQKHKRYFAI
jgi:hypothetical protein